MEGSLARRIAELAGVGPGDRVVEVGAGLGSLTVALAATGARVVAVEVDPRLHPALAEVVAPFPGVEPVLADAVRADWAGLLEGLRWTMVGNLPYNVAVPIVTGVLEREPRIRKLLVMVQREVGERLVAGPGQPAFGAVSLRVAYRAESSIVRRVPASVFWPRPSVESVLVALMRRRHPPVEADETALFELIRVAFAQRRKTMTNALLRFGMDRPAAAALLERCGVAPAARPEELGLAEFARLAAGATREGPA